MILLSRIIKQQWTTPFLDEQKVISIKKLQTIILDDSSQNQLQNAVIQKEMLSRAVEEAEQIVKEAQLKAQSIYNQVENEKQDWEQEKAKLIDGAKREGFTKGMTEGRNQGYNEYHQTILMAQEVVDNSKKDYLQQIASAERTILQLGIKVAEKILGEKLEDNESFLSLVKNALKEVREYQDVKIHVNPRHYEFLLSRKEELTAILTYENDIYIYPNNELSETACTIESAKGRIDAAIDSQLEEMKIKLLELLESGA